MKNTFGETAKSFVKNPIGIIGLFLVFVEAITATVIVKSTLVYSLNLLLVLFVVLFPIMVLIMFYLLVTRHHEKLYSPSDYRDEKNFVSTYNSVTKSQEFVVEDAVLKEDTFLTKEGMTEADIGIIKEMLNNLMSMQKDILLQNKELESVEIIDNVEKDINMRLDEYVIEKQYDYKVEVSLIKGSREFVDELILDGYNADIYLGIDGKNKKLQNYVEHEAIWVGEKVPFDMAIDVVRKAKNMFPHLKYIDMFGDFAPEYVAYQVYVGGATSTALKNKLKKLSLSDFEKMYTMNSNEELHDYIFNINN